MTEQDKRRSRGYLVPRWLWKLVVSAFITSICALVTQVVATIGWANDVDHKLMALQEGYYQVMLLPQEMAVVKNKVKNTDLSVRRIERNQVQMNSQINQKLDALIVREMGK